ncbi:MAG: hypothetical protein RSA55_08660, partial [Clostridia bacterium]
HLLTLVMRAGLGVGAWMHGSACAVDLRLMLLHLLTPLLRTGLGVDAWVNGSACAVDYALRSCIC